MAVYYVFQGKTYIQEREGEYVWSPQVDKLVRNNVGYKMMTNIRKGDFILHSSKGKILSVSVAQTDCYTAQQPKELCFVNRWNNEGYRIDTKYFDFDIPLNTTDYKDW